jgi:hypothetical protein
MSKRNWFRVLLAAGALAFMLGVARPSTSSIAAPTPTPTPTTDPGRGGDPGHG